jgi:threonine dehydratase
MTLSLADVQLAAERIAGSVARTPFLHSQTLSDLTGAEIWLKFENLQFTGSFKERGALNKLLTLTEDQRRRGVVAVSAGNHAQGVALHARRLNIPATIIMPSGTPAVKVARTASFGATVELTGSNFAEASESVDKYVQQGLTFVPPFNDHHVIAGQGTIALEMIEQGPPLDAVLVSVGGGGMIGGIGTVYNSLAPQTQIIGVESELYPSMAIAMHKHDGPLLGGTSIAEGIAVAKPGELTLDIARAVVDDMLVISEVVIEDAVALLLQIEKTVCEGAGAAGLAAVLAEPERFKGKRLGLVLCGGNIDIRVLTAMLQRYLVRAGQLVRLRVTMADDAGALGKAATIIGQHGGNILDVTHDRIFGGSTPRSANAVFTVELPDWDRHRIMRVALIDAGFEVQPTDLSAKHATWGRVRSEAAAA